MLKKYTVIDLFSGVGGLSFGFAEDRSFEIIAANEILPNMAKAYSLNHPKVRMFCTDVTLLTFVEMAKGFGLKKGDVDVVIGGPPCQAYSTVGRRSAEDPRGKLFMEFYRMLSEIFPRVFVFENVKGLLSMQSGTLIKDIISLFESLGYLVRFQILNAADYGAPQIRERVIIVGTRISHSFDFPNQTHSDQPNKQDRSSQCMFDLGLSRYLTLGEAISDLSPLNPGKSSTTYLFPPLNAFQDKMRQGAPDKVMDHSAPEHSSYLKEIMRLLPEGGGPESLPLALRPKSGFKNTYSRLWWDRPSTTITRNLGTPSSSRCIHPRDPRPLTTREGARLQCFPDRYHFYGTRSDKNLQIGNAVPTVLSIAIKDAIKAHLQNAYAMKNKGSFYNSMVQTVTASPFRA